MNSRCLSAGGRRFLDHHNPAGAFCLPCGRLTGVLDPAPDPVGVSMSRAVEMRPGWVPSLLRSHRCPRRRVWKTGVLGSAITVFVSHPSVIGYNGSVMRGFTFVHPSGLPLACAVRDGSLALGFNPVLAPHPYGRRTPDSGTGVWALAWLRMTSATLSCAVSCRLSIGPLPGPTAGVSCARAPLEGIAFPVLSLLWGTPTYT
jgi:hypothetical protein